MTRIRIENGSGYKLVICSCGWREQVFTEATLQAVAQSHKTLVHDDATGGSSYAGKRRERYGS